MKAILIDCEATGLDTKTDRITDLAWMIVDDQFNALYSEHHLMWDDTYPVLSPEVEKLTGITQADLMKADTPLNVFNKMNNAILEYKPDVLIAYNMEYDGPLLLNEIERGGFGLFPGINQLRQMHTLCAMRDVEDNYNYKCWKLSHLSLDKGIAIDPSKLHRAMADVFLMRDMLAKSQTSVKQILEYNLLPWVVVRAVTNPPWEDKGVSNAIAQKRGYTWQKVKGDPQEKIYEKAWVKRIKERDYEKEAKECPLPVRIIK